MTPEPAPQAYVPDPQERARLNAAFLATGAETGIWDDHGNPTLWPDDIDDWTPAIHQPDPNGQYDF